jgi:hypothetical protein
MLVHLTKSVAHSYVNTHDFNIKSPSSIYIKGEFYIEILHVCLCHKMFTNGAYYDDFGRRGCPASLTKFPRVYTKCSVFYSEVQNQR